MYIYISLHISHYVVFVFCSLQQQKPCSSSGVGRIRMLTASLLLLKLQAVDEHSLQLADVISGFYRNTHPAGRA